MDVKDKAMKWVFERADWVYGKIDALEQKIVPTTDENFLSIYKSPLDKKAATKLVSFADSLCSKYLSYDSLSADIEEYETEFCSISEQRRAEIVGRWINDSQLPDSVLVSGPQNITFSDDSTVGKDYLNGIARIKTRSNNYDAASFVSSVALGIVLGPFSTIYDACDMAAGLYLTKKASELAQKDLEEYSKALLKSKIKSFEEYSNLTFDEFKKEVESTQSKLLRYVQELL